MNRPAAALVVAPEDHRILEAWSRRQTAPHHLVARARAILMAEEGTANSRIAAALGPGRPTVIEWRARLDGLTQVRPGRGRKPGIGVAKVQAIVRATLHEKPPGAAHWSCRTMARAQGISPAAVQRIWEAHGLRPHRVATFTLSRDPHRNG